MKYIFEDVRRVMPEMNGKMIALLEKIYDYVAVKKGITKKLPKWMKHLFVLCVIPVTWMCFAITKVEDLKIYLGRMFGFMPLMRRPPRRAPRG